MSLKPIKATERTNVSGTGKSKYMAKGRVYSVHPETAKRLIANGAAVAAKDDVKTSENEDLT